MFFERQVLFMYYVTATDKFMSGWGLAKGKTKKVIVICEK